MRSESCNWIDDAPTFNEVSSRRLEHCKKNDVKQACRRACGECCGDNQRHVFKNTVEGRFIPVTCKWLAQGGDIRRERYCGEKKGSCPKACGECDKCIDDPDFVMVINKETRKTAPCSWIDDAYSIKDVMFRRQQKCKVPTVRKACKRACGLCCGDNNEHSFLHIDDETMTKVDCDWLSTAGEIMQDRYCDSKKGSCPHACGECRIVDRIEPPPTSFCRDEPDFKILIDAQTGRREPCSWIDDAYSVEDVLSRRSVQCAFPNVRKACKRACGLCCGDNDLHSFTHINQDKEIEADCFWLSTRKEMQDRYCHLKKATCPVACGKCEQDKILTETDETKCQDNPDFRILINAKKGRSEPCSWIDDGDNIDEVLFRRKEQCKKAEVKKACRRSCGECCGDNDNHTFDVKGGKSGSCSWLAENNSRIAEYCPMKEASCPETCGVCTGKEINSKNEVDTDDHIPPTIGGALMTTSEALKPSPSFGPFLCGLGLLAVLATS